MDDLLKAILGILDQEENKITVRHLFYRLVGLGIIEKTEAAYCVLKETPLARWVHREAAKKRRQRRA